MTASHTRRSQALRALALMGLGLGLTWAAGQWSGGPPSVVTLATGASPPPASTLAQDAGGAPAGAASGGDLSETAATNAGAGESAAGDSGGPATGANDAPAPTVEDVSTEELEAEIRELERAVGEATGGRAPPDPGEMAADKPLSADIAIALPSDI